MTNAEKAEATGNKYVHTKTNRSMHRHKQTHPCKHRYIKIIKHNKIYKTSSM